MCLSNVRDKLARSDEIGRKNGKDESAHDDVIAHLSSHSWILISDSIVTSSSPITTTTFYSLQRKGNEMKYQIQMNWN